MVAANQTRALREGANVMLIIGCDFHPGFQQIAIFDNQTGAYEERRLSHRAEAEQFYRSLAGHEPGSAEEVEVVDGGGTGGVGGLGVVALRGPAPETTAAPAGRSGGGDRCAEPASGRRSERPAGGREVDDASGSGSGDRVGDGADAGTGG